MHDISNGHICEERGSLRRWLARLLEIEPSRYALHIDLCGLMAINATSKHSIHHDCEATMPTQHKSRILPNNTNEWPALGHTCCEKHDAQPGAMIPCGVDEQWHVKDFIHWTTTHGHCGMTDVAMLLIMSHKSFSLASLWGDARQRCAGVAPSSATGGRRESETAGRCANPWRYTTEMGRRAKAERVRRGGEGGQRASEGCGAGKEGGSPRLCTTAVTCPFQISEITIITSLPPCTVPGRCPSPCCSPTSSLSRSAPKPLL